MKITATANNSMDVRAKQRLCYLACLFPLTLRVAVSPHVISAVRFRHLELNGADDGNGVQITLSDDTADITVPYWHTGDTARQTFEEIWSYLKLLEAQGGFVTYDPQLEQILNLVTDFSSVLKTYEEVSSNM